MTASHVVTLSADTSRLQAALTAFDDAALALIEGRSDLIGLLGRPEELVAINSHRLGASSAGETVIVFEPSDRLLSLLTAAGAIDRYRFLVENAGHNSPSNAVGSGERSIAGAEAGVMPVSDAGEAAA